MDGRGGYSGGYDFLQAGDILYIAIGGTGSYSGSGVTGSGKGGYNGGGHGENSGSDAGGTYGGGGATHIALGTNRGVLANYNSYRSEVLIVAGGGRWNLLERFLWISFIRESWRRT